MGNGADGHSYTHSSVMTYSNSGQGQPKVFQASTSTAKAPGGVSRSCFAQNIFQLANFLFGFPDQRNSKNAARFGSRSGEDGGGSAHSRSRVHPDEGARSQRADERGRAAAEHRRPVALRGRVAFTRAHLRRPHATTRRRCGSSPEQPRVHRQVSASTASRAAPVKTCY